MKRVLILTAHFFLVLMIVSCVENAECSDNENKEQMVPCSSDINKEQKQVCQEGIWVNEGPCLCKAEDIFCHSHKGFNWSDASSDSMTWDEAAIYCKNLGGRLPTISELRTLIQNCSATETGGECKVTDDCLSSVDCFNGSNHACDGCEYNGSGKYSVFGDTNLFWSSSEQSDIADFAWFVYFYNGSVNYDYKDHYYYFYVRCVR